MLNLLHFPGCWPWQKSCFAERFCNAYLLKELVCFLLSRTTEHINRTLAKTKIPFEQKQPFMFPGSWCLVTNSSAFVDLYFAHKLWFFTILPPSVALFVKCEVFTSKTPCRGWPGKEIWHWIQIDPSVPPLKFINRKSAQVSWSGRAKIIVLLLSQGHSLSQAHGLNPSVPDSCICPTSVSRTVQIHFVKHCFSWFPFVLYITDMGVHTHRRAVCAEVQQTCPLLFWCAPIARSVKQIPFGHSSLALNCSCDTKLLMWCTILSSMLPICQLEHRTCKIKSRAETHHCLRQASLVHRAHASETSVGCARLLMGEDVPLILCWSWWGTQSWTKFSWCGCFGCGLLRVWTVSASIHSGFLQKWTIAASNCMTDTVTWKSTQTKFSFQHVYCTYNFHSTNFNHQLNSCQFIPTQIAAPSLHARRPLLSCELKICRTRWTHKNWTGTE